MSDTQRRPGRGRELLSRDGQPHGKIANLPIDVLEHVYHFLDAKDVFALSRSCKLLRNVASSHTVWAEVVQRSFSPEELPQDVSFLSSKDTPRIRAQFWQLTRQRPAFLSDAPRTSEVVEHAGSRFLKVLHIDGRRDLNFTTVFRDVPPGQFNVVWRIMLQPGYVRGYCNFRAVFSRPTPAAKARGKARAAAKLRLMGSQEEAQPQRGGRSCHRGRGRLAGNLVAVAPLENEPEPEVAALAEPQAGPPSAKWRLRRRLWWLPSCATGAAAGSVVPQRLTNGQRTAARPAAAPVVAPAAAPAARAQAASVPPVAADGTVPPRAPSPRAALPHRHLHDGQAQQHSLNPNDEPHPPQPQLNPQHLLNHPEIEPLPLPQPDNVQNQPTALLQEPVLHGPQPQPQPQPPGPEPEQQVQLQRAMGQLARASAKRDATLAVSGGPRYVSRWLSPLWGSYASSWRQLDPAGPLRHGTWHTMHVGTVTVRRQVDVHLHGVTVQLRPANAEQQEAAMPPGETQWRGTLVDYVELVPTRQGGLMDGLVPGFLLSGSPVYPEASDVVVVPRL